MRQIALNCFHPLHYLNQNEHQKNNDWTKSSMIFVISPVIFCEDKRSSRRSNHTVKARVPGFVKYKTTVERRYQIRLLVPLKLSLFSLFLIVPSYEHPPFAIGELLVASLHKREDSFQVGNLELEGGGQLLLLHLRTNQHQPCLPQRGQPGC